MAKSPGSNPVAAFGEASRFTELRRRFFFLLGGLIVYRIGTFIPVPGIDPVALARLFQDQQGTILSMFNMFSGGALQRLSILALGVMPYISASIIVQMMAVVIPTLQALRKEGEAGRRKLTQYTRMGTVALAIFQAAGAAVAFQNQGVVINAGVQFVFIATLTLTAGTMFLMWLGEQITERGLGNGISMIILAGIVAGLPAAIGGTLELVRNGEINPALALLLIMMVAGVTIFVVFVERAQRKIPVNYAKRQQGRRMMAGTTTHLPFKLNMSGVIPPIFASSLLLFPATIASWFGTNDNLAWLQSFAASLGVGQPVHMLLYGALIIFFCFFYTALQYNPKETADNLKKSGAFIPGYRPGDQTAKYLEKITTRLTLLGSLYLVAVCFVPNFLIAWKNVPFYFGGTSLLIIVVVTMDFMTQVQAYMMSQQYESLLRKANFKGGLPTR